MTGIWEPSATVICVAGRLRRASFRTLRALCDNCTAGGNPWTYLRGG